MLMGSRRFMAWLRKAQGQVSCKPSLRGYSQSFVYALGLAAFPCKRCMRISFCAKGSTDNFALTWMLTSSRSCVNEAWKVIFKSSRFFKLHCTFQLLQNGMAFTCNHMQYSLVTLGNSFGVESLKPRMNNTIPALCCWRYIFKGICLKQNISLGTRQTKK